MLHQTDYDDPQELKFLMSEIWSAALLDSGSGKTACSNEWFSQYVNNLCEQDQQQIQYSERNHMYRFGGGKKVKATHRAKIPALIGNNHIKNRTDVIENDIPLLLSKLSMKKAEMSRFSE